MVSAQQNKEKVTDLLGLKKDLCNVVEPDYLIETFLNHPPVGFKSMQVASEGLLTPAFLADFNLLTTLDEEARQLKEFFRKFPFLARLLSFPTLFVGTTATEYANYPYRADYQKAISSLLQKMRLCKAQLLIVKDIPCASPLLTELENEASELVVKQCQEAGFLIVEGQALAYVPIDFKSVDEYMLRLSKVRRKEFRKKLKESSAVRVEELSCGASEFFDEQFLDVLYGMYLNVFAQSEIHFDLLSREFFKELLQNRDGGGRVFCYKLDGKLIGYNVCFVHEDRLVDKYVGFLYPEARQSNLYFISWFYNLEYALKNGLKTYIAGWTDPAVKASLGAKFTMTRHAVFIANPILRAILTPMKHLFESDSNYLEKTAQA